MLLDNQLTARCQSIKYIGVHLLSGKGVSFDTAQIKCAVYAACNNIFVILVMLMKLYSRLIKKHCLPVLLYASSAPYLKPKQSSVLKVYWNSIYRTKIFNYKRVPQTLFMFGLARLDLSKIIMLLRVSIYNHLAVTDNSILSDLY